MIELRDKDVQVWINDIYTNVYTKMKEQFIVVFLCGGASNYRDKSLRDKTRPLLEDLKNMHIKVFYPEDLLIDVLNQTKDADLLNYEQLLAENSHVICIICESPGSLVELGAFTNNSYTVGKVIAAIDKNRVKDKSFIMLGPIRYLSKLDKNNIVKYGKVIDPFIDNLSKSIRYKYINNRDGKKLQLSNIMGMHYFIQLLLYFFKHLNSKELIDIIKYIAKKNKIDIVHIDVIFSASLKLLFHEKSIIKINKEQYSQYKLSKSGYLDIEKNLKNCTDVYTCDRIRTDIMYHIYYKSSCS